MSTLAPGRSRLVLAQLDKLLLAYSRKRDWVMVALLLRTIENLMRRGEI